MRTPGNDVGPGTLTVREFREARERLVELRERLPYAAGVVERDAGNAQARDGEGHGDAVVAVGGDLGGVRCAGVDLDPVAAGLDP